PGDRRPGRRCDRHLFHLGPKDSLRHHRFRAIQASGPACCGGPGQRQLVRQSRTQNPRSRGVSGSQRLTPMSEYSCLIVEDSPMMRQLLVFALARIKNLRVTEADDGVDGLRKLASASYDIIVTDINMPIMDGLKLVKRVRSDPAHKDTPIVIITTEGSQEDRQRALQLGANAYITRPIQAPQVIATVKELLKID